MATPKNTHQKWPDFVRALAAYLVVMIHSGAGGGGSVTLSATIYCTLSKPAVLWFFMLSGYLLIGKQEPLADFFRKRLFKVIIPLVFFSILFGGLNYRTLAYDKSQIYHMLTHGIHFHLWFLHALTVCYLVIPFLRVICAKGIALPLYLLAVWFFFSRWMPIERRLLDVSDIVFGPNSSYIGIYAGYLVIGWLIGNYQLSPKLRLPVSLIWLFSSIASGIAACAGQPWATFGLGYASPFLMISSSSGLLLLKSLIENSHSKWIDAVCRMAPLSLGIYLIHPLLLEYLWPKNLLSLDPAAMIPLKTTSIFILSAFAVVISRKFKVGRLLMP